MEMVSMGAGFQLIPFPCLTQILLKKIWNTESELSQDDHSSYPVGERLGGIQPRQGCATILRKSLVSS